MIKCIYSVTIEGISIKTVWDREVEKVFTFRYEHTYKAEDRKERPTYVEMWDDFFTWCAICPEHEVRVLSAGVGLLLIKPYRDGEKMITNYIELRPPYPYNFDGHMSNKYLNGEKIE